MTRSSVAFLLLAWCSFGVPLTAQAENAPLPLQPIGVPWPTVEWPTAAAPDGAEAPLRDATERLFAPVGRGGVSDARALLVVQRGRIVLERYADGFGPDSRFHSWSLAKSITQALVGILVRDGALALDARAPVEVWAGPDDPRREITLRHLLQMTSGIDNADQSDDGDFAGRVLFGDLAEDGARASADRELVHAPGTHWAYSTGTGSILAAIVEREVGGDVRGMLDFMERELLAPLGVRSFVPEFDRAGTFIGGAMAWANARDWARLGFLFLRDGVWDGRRILPEGWVDFSRTPAPVANNGTFGAHFWIRAEPAPDQFGLLRPGIEAFVMSGNQGQLVVLVPRRDLVVVRLGEMQATTWPAIHEVLSDLIEAFPLVEGAR